MMISNGHGFNSEIHTYQVLWTGLGSRRFAENHTHGVDLRVYLQSWEKHDKTDKLPFCTQFGLKDWDYELYAKPHLLKIHKSEEMNLTKLMLNGTCKSNWQGWVE